MLNFLVVGIGQCGNKFADEFAGCRMKAIAVNTTDKDMSKLSNIDKQNLINISINNNGGAGKTPEIGQISMMQNIEAVCRRIDAVGQDADYILLWAGLGGGTGSGGLPVLMKELKKREKNIIVGMTIPDSSEGYEVKMNALRSCISILKLAEKKRIPFVIIDNNQVKNNLDMDSDIDRAAANQKIVRVISQFNKYANQASSVATFDETDYRKTLAVPGMIIVTKTVIPVTDIHTADSLRDAVIKDWHTNKFYTEYDVSTARMFTTIVNAPKKWLENRSNIKLLESCTMSLRSECGTVSPYSGIYSYNDGVKNGLGNIVIYTMLTGLKAPMERLIKLQEDAVKENEEIKKKEQENKIDFSAFSSINEEEKEPSFSGLMNLEDDDNDDEDGDTNMDATLELLRRQGLMK